MTAPVVLLTLVAVLVLKIIPSLNGALWPSRSPALGILCWQAVSYAVMGSLTFAGLALAVPQLPVGDSLADFLHACTTALRSHYSTPGGALPALLGGALALGLVLRFAVVLSRLVVQNRRDRARQFDLLAVVCQSHPEDDVVVVDHGVPAVYCLPGHQRRIVVTQGAVTALSPIELSQVLAHERAHLRSRHHVVVIAAQALATTFGQHLGLATARDRIVELAEMHADDAGDPARRAELASALFILAGGARPSGSLGASGASSDAARARIERLVAPAAPIPVPQRRALAFVAGLLLVAPAIIAVSPAVEVAMVGYCPTLLL